MNRESPSSSRAAAVLVAAGVAAVLSAAGGNAHAQSSSAEAGLAGTWMVQVTLRNCDTNAVIGVPFMSLVTFHRGGTMSESTGSPAFAAGQRSDGHGSWAYLGGSRYRQETIALIRFDTPPTPPVSPGFSRGFSTISHTVDLVDRDHFASEGTNAFYDANGQVYRTGCSSAEGLRFE